MKKVIERLDMIDGFSVLGDFLFMFVYAIGDAPEHLELMEVL